MVRPISNRVNLHNQVATKSRIYLFDVVSLGDELFSAGMQNVLESKAIYKVKFLFQ